jgi:hypothetical protein
MMGRACVATMGHDALGNVMEALELGQAVEQYAVACSGIVQRVGELPAVGTGPAPEIGGVQHLATVQTAMGIDASTKANVSGIVTPAGVGVGAIGLLVGDFATAIDG